MICHVSHQEIVDAIKIHWKLQLGCYFKTVEDLSGAMYNLGDRVVDYFWNYAGLITTTEKDADQLIDRIIAFANKNDRVPAIYIDPTVRPENFKNCILNKGFSLASDEIWMFYSSSELPRKEKPNELAVKRVKTIEEMQAFVEVFDAAYEMGEEGAAYALSLLDAFKHPQENVEIFHYLGSVREEPVSIASVYISDDVAGIYNVGTLSNHRKKGYGGALSTIAIEEALNQKVRRLLLQTELDSGPESLYKQLGFKQAFSGEIWSLE